LTPTQKFHKFKFTQENKKLTNQHCNDHLYYQPPLSTLFIKIYTQHTKTMSDDFFPPAIPTTADAPQTHPPLVLLIMDVAPSTEPHQDAKSDAKSTQAPNKLKTKKLHLPHPSSLDVLPSPTNKWIATTHPIKAWVVGFLGYHISYKHFYFHQSRVLHTKAFATSTIASTVDNGGKPKGSTELNTVCGHNCAMMADEYAIFILLVLGLCLGKQHGTERSECSFVNMLLKDFVTISNLTAVFALNKPEDRCALARMLARFSLLLLGAEALTPKIIANVWGQNDMICRNLGGPRSNLALTCHQLISLACVANNTFHLWLTTTLNGGMIIPDEALQHPPLGMRDILHHIKQNAAAIYVGKPLH
jgi:hypothetical protein